jgi:hypothetical protein
MWNAYILVSEMLEQFELAVCALRQNRSAEGLHDLLDGDGLAGELVLGRAARLSVCASVPGRCKRTRQVQRLPCPPAEGQCIYATSVLLPSQCGVCFAHLLVISNVVPKIWARTNSAMVMCGRGDPATGAGRSVYGGEVVVLLWSRQ